MADRPLLPPAGFPANFPDPPSGVPLFRTSLAENAIEDMDGAQHGTVVRRVIWFDVGNGREEDVDAVLAHYRVALPAAGWTVDREEELAVDPDRGREHPGSRLRISGSGHEDVVVTAELRNDRVSVTVGVFESLIDRAPYWTHSPIIELPDWFAGLAELPDGAMREGIEITEELGQTNTARIVFRIGDPSARDSNLGLLDTTTDHYRTALPTSGWSVVDDTSESENGSGAVQIDTERRVLRFEFEGATGTFTASQSTVSSETGPGPVKASVTVSTNL